MNIYFLQQCHEFQSTCSQCPVHAISGSLLHDPAKTTFKTAIDLRKSQVTQMSLICRRVSAKRPSQGSSLYRTGNFSSSNLM